MNLPMNPRSDRKLPEDPREFLAYLRLLGLRFSREPGRLNIAGPAPLLRELEPVLRARVRDIARALRAELEAILTEEESKALVALRVMLQQGTLRPELEAEARALLDALHRARAEERPALRKRLREVATRAGLLQ